MIEQMKTVATSAIDAMKANPLMLGVLLLNALIFLAIYFSVQEGRKHQDEQMKLILERCLPKGG